MAWPVNLTNHGAFAIRVSVGMALLVVHLFGISAALAGGLGAGDGSFSSNPDLITQPINVGCAVDCPALVPEYALPEVIVTDDRLLAGPPAEQLPPRGVASPFFETDWSIALRGTYSRGTAGSAHAFTLAPSMTLTRYELRGQYDLEASANITITDARQTRVEDVRVQFDGDYQLDRTSNLSGEASLNLSQQDPNAPGVANDIIATPLRIQGEAALALSRQMGNLEFGLGGNIARDARSQSILTGDVVQDNSALNSTRLGGSLRAAYTLSPIVAPFIEGSVEKIVFDAAPIATGIKLDGWEYALRAGILTNWRNVVEIEASVGYGLRRFEAGLPDLESVLYALNFAIAPEEDVSLDIELSTSLNPGDPDAGAPASVDYQTSVDAAYLVNSWLNLRGSIGGVFTPARFGQAGQITYSAGAGLDYMLSDHTSFTLDYDFTKSIRAAQATEHAHEVSLGVTFSR